MVQLLAFSLQDQVEKYGAYIGIAAFFGLAVLSILYFAQARELRRLRDWAGRAPERAAEMEARVVAQAEAARRGPAAVSRPVPATAAAAAGGGAAATTASGEQATQVVDPPQEEQAAATTSGNGTTEAAADAAEQETEHATGANGKAGEGVKGAAVAAGAAAAAKAAGEKKPDDEEEAEGEAKPDAEAAQPTEGDTEPGAEGAEAESAGATAAAGDATTGAERAEGEAKPDAEGATPEDAKPAEAAPEEPGGDAQPGEIPVAPVPRATPLPRRAPAPAAPLRQPSRSTTLPPRRPAPGQRKSPVTPAASNPRTSRRLLIGGAIGILALLVIVLLVTGVFNGSDNGSSPPAASTTASPSGGTPSQGSSTSALTPADTNVAVLNGTTIPGLASTEKDKLVSAGFTADKVTTGNNTDQQRADSQVLYGTENGARSQARTIAQKLDITSIQRLDADTRDLSSNADVVVILGQDKAP